MTTHLAAVSLGKGEPFEVQARPTPKPGPGELLVEVKSVAINPADGYMRQGLFISSYPTVIGFDMSGLVLEVSENVPVGNADQGAVPLFQPGITRVAGYAASFWRSCSPDYGVFQEKCLVPWQHVVPLPDEGISWNEAATLPVSIQVPLNAWDAMKISRIGEPGERAQKNEKHKSEVLLIWGGSSSVGTMGVQTARLLREDRRSPFAAVYATAGTANHNYVHSLGADRVFDYKEPEVVEAIVSAAKKEGLVIRYCFLAMGQLASCQAVLQAFVGHGEGEDRKAKIASAPLVPTDAEEINGMETIFLQPSADEEERLSQFQYWLGTWLEEKLFNGTIKPSPEPRVVGKGLGFLNAALDEVLQGVSCTKLVVEVAE